MLILNSIQQHFNSSTAKFTYVDSIQVHTFFNVVLALQLDFKAQYFSLYICSN